MTDIRKIITYRETIFSELGHAAARPIVRSVGIAVIRNPFAGRWVEDLRELWEAGAFLGERLMPELVRLLDGPAVSYGKGALVGVGGEMKCATGGVVSVVKPLNGVKAGFALRLDLRSPALEQKLQVASGSSGSRQWYQKSRPILHSLRWSRISS